MNIKIYLPQLNEEITVAGGSSLLDLHKTIADRMDFEPVCALVNNKIESLHFPLFNPKTVSFLPAGSAAGNRTYVRSLCMMLYHGVHTLFPGAKMRIEHSMANGYFCRVKFSDGNTLSHAHVARLKAHMDTLSAASVPFIRREERTDRVIEMFRNQGLDDKATLFATLHEPYTVYYTLNEIADSYYGPLAPHTGMLRAFNLIPYEDGMLLLGPDRKRSDRCNVPTVQPKMFEAFKDYVAFNSILGISLTGELNKEIDKGESRAIVNLSEALHNNRIASIADDITHRFHKGEARVVMIAGPSSSGKTTFTKRLAIQLMTNLIRPKMISLDDYFVDREHTPLDSDGEFDYESLHALDLKTFNRHINALIEGHEVELPYYNFTTGRREYRGNRLKLSADNILLIEGIHGLNPELTSQVADNLKYRVYVSALTTISIDDHNWIPTTDNRLLRRIIRDAKYRGVSPADTIKRWPSVRRGEERWIFPFQENADIMFNSSLLYELAVIKDRASELLRQVPHDIQEYAEASRLRTFLNYFHSIPEAYMPSTSLLREFMGGSSFRY